MRSVLVFIIFLMGGAAMAETFQIPFENGAVEITGDVVLSDDENSFDVENVEISIPSLSHGSLHLVAEFGWGDGPYNFLCKTISLATFETEEYQYASAYGYLQSIGGLSSLFSTPEFFIVKRDMTFEVSESYPNSSYDSGFSCYNYKVEY